MYVAHRIRHRPALRALTCVFHALDGVRAPPGPPGGATSCAAAAWCHSHSLGAGAGCSDTSHGHSHGGQPCGGHSHSHGGEGGAAQGVPPPPDEKGTVPEVAEEDTVTPPAAPPPEDSGLPLAQRVKNIMGANWRGQLSTVVSAPAATKQPHRPKVHGSLVPCAMLSEGQTVVFLQGADPHVQVRGALCRSPSHHKQP
jgi:hypothetical protein